MKMTVNNKSIRVGKVEVAGLGNASLLLIGDAETIVSSSYFDTPANSVIINPNAPLQPNREEAFDKPRDEANG